MDLRAEVHTSGAALLALWEHGLSKPAVARDDALLHATTPDGAVPLALTERNATLIELHARLFGRDVKLTSRCPSCASVAEFDGDCEALAGQMRRGLDDASPSHRLETAGHRIEFRLPDSIDVAAAIAAGSDREFAQRLLERCVLACTRDGDKVPLDRIPAPVLDVLSQRMEKLAPGASVNFALECPQCAARWNAPLDVGLLVWQKVQAAAECLLLDIDALARSYGWTERDVLRLSPLRRAAYVQMVTS